jgi:mannose-6-phosphate isomerase-like protein (cupin superfamily)/oxalate decarboxylase/phosphoglucose isomerase-like protein (cupin superfamily)
MTVQTSAKPTWDQKQINAYEEFQKREGIPAHKGFAIPDVRKVELGYWARLGANAAFVDLEGTGGANAAYIGEVPPGQSTHPMRHMYEEIVYILDGSGSTSVWHDEDKKNSFEWGPGSLFAIPLNAWFQFHNARGNTPARYLSVITAPIVFNLFHNEKFVFDNPFRFEDRFSGESEYFSPETAEHHDTPQGRHVVLTNFIPDIHTATLHFRPARGAGGRIGFWDLADNTMTVHCSEFGVGTYKKRHRHGPGAHVIILEGVGFSLLWQEGEEEYKQCDWRPGAVVVPPDNWFHQHFNSGAEPARYLALRFSGIKYRQAANSQRGEGADVSVKQGGWQIEYEDEARSVHELFERELAKHGAPCRMKAFIPWCTGEVGPNSLGSGGD